MTMSAVNLVIEFIKHQNIYEQSKTIKNNTEVKLPPTNALKN